MIRNPWSADIVMIARSSSIRSETVEHGSWFDCLSASVATESGTIDLPAGAEAAPSPRLLPQDFADIESFADIAGLRQANLASRREMMAALDNRANFVRARVHIFQL